MERNELKQVLQNIDENLVVPKGYTIHSFTMETLKYIGDTDPVLRDDLVLNFLIYVIIKNKVDDELVKEILKICLENIFDGIGKEDDSVFIRTFSMYLISVCLARHRETPYLSRSEIKTAFEKVIDSYTLDKDVRGYIDAKGWAHGAAHGADTIAEFAKLKETNELMQKEILKAIQQKVMVEDYGYIHNEDGRMVKPILAIMARKEMPLDYFKDWLDGFLIEKERGVFFLVKRSNINHYLSNLYFKVDDANIRNKIEETIKHNDNL